MTAAVAVCEGRIAVRPLRRPGAAPPLFLISAPGVNALGYVALARALPPGETPCAVEPLRRPLRTRRELEPAEIEDLAAEYLAAVRAYQPKGPYFLAGMCDGAHLAFAMARRLEAEGDRVALLALFDTWPVENSSYYPLVVLAQIRYRLSQLHGRERLAWIGRSVLRGLGALRDRVAGSAKEDTGPTTRQRWRARAWPGPGFVPPVYGGRITVIRAKRQPFFRRLDPALGWRARSRQEVTVVRIAGDHDTLLREPHVRSLARALAQSLAAARGPA